MDQLTSHIEKLLVNHNFVIIPGLGGLVVQEESASLDGDFIHSPRAQVGFNPKMNQQDGLLTLALSRSLKISFREAEQKVADLVKEAISRMNGGHAITLGNLGTLSIRDDRFRFEPELENYILPSNLAMVSYRLRKNSKTVPLIQYSTPGWIKYAAAAVIFISLFFTSGSLNKHQSIQTANISNIPFVTLKDFVVTAEKPAPAAKDLSSKPFHVVVAAFYSPAIAEKHCKLLQEKQFSDAFVIAGTKTNKIVANSFESYSEAITYMKQLRASDKAFKDAWVLKN